MNWRGNKATMIRTSVVATTSTNNWGLLDKLHTEFSDDEDGMRLWSDVGDVIDYYICMGRR